MSRLPMNKTAFQLKADHSLACVYLDYLHSYDLNLDLMNLILKLDLDVMKTYRHIKKEICRSMHSKVGAR